MIRSGISVKSFVAAISILLLIEIPGALFQPPPGPPLDFNRQLVVDAVVKELGQESSAKTEEAKPGFVARAGIFLMNKPPSPARGGPRHPFPPGPPRGGPPRGPGPGRRGPGRPQRDMYNKFGGRAKYQNSAFRNHRMHRRVDYNEQDYIDGWRK